MMLRHLTMRSLAPRRLVVAALLAATLGACTQWQVAPGTTPDVLAGVGEGRVRFTLVDGRRVAMHAPRVEGDSIVGFEAARSNGARRAVARADVARRDAGGRRAQCVQHRGARRARRRGGVGGARDADRRDGAHV